MATLVTRSQRGPIDPMLLGILSMVLLNGARSIPSICVGYELKQNTLSSLAILPAGATAIYQGWLRGKRELQTQNWLAGGVIIAAMITLDPVRGMLWALAGVATAYALPPVMFVQTLGSQERSWRSAIGGIVGGCTSLLIRPLGALPIVLLGAVAALLFRPRAVRQMDDRFLAASAR